MKCLLAICLLLAYSVGFAAAANEDPGAQYVDAFLLLQEGDAAKGKSDWKTAYTKFSAAQNILASLKESAPNWNPHLVQFRLDYCVEQLNAIKPNIAPTAPPLSATIVAPPKPPRPGATETADTHQLRADLADATRRVQEAQQQLDALRRENQSLTVALEAAKKAMPAVAPEAVELDKLRTQLADARTEIERAKAAQLSAQASLNKKDADEAARMAEVNQKIADLQKEIADRNRKLEEMERVRAAATKATERADASDAAAKAANDRAAELAKQKDQLTAQLNEMRATAGDDARKAAEDLAALKKNNDALALQLADAKQRAENLETEAIKKLQAQLTELRAAAEQSQSTSDTRINDLRKTNRELQTRLTDAERVNAAGVVETKKLNADLADARAAVERANKTLVERDTVAATQIEQWKKEGQALTAQLAANAEAMKKTQTDLAEAKRQGASSDEALKKTQSDLAEARTALDLANQTGSKRTAAINARIEQLKQEKQLLTAQLDDVKRQSAAAADDAIKLRADLAAARAAVERASKTGAERDTLANAQMDRLQKENQTLTVALADAKRATADGSTDAQKLRRDLADVRIASAARIEELSRERRDLAAQLADAEKRADKTPNKGFLFFKSPAPVTTATVVEDQLRQENNDLATALGSAKDQIDKLRRQVVADTKTASVRARKTDDELASLKEQNRDLAVQLATMKRTGASAAAAATGAGNRGFVYRAASRTTSGEPVRTAATDRLEKENANLSDQLAEARRQMAALNRELETKTAAVQAANKAAAKAAAAVKPAPTESEALAKFEEFRADSKHQMDRLREENALLRQLLNRYATHHPELKREAQGRPITVGPRKQ